MHTYTHTYMYTQYIHIHMHEHTYIHTYIYTHIHTHMHIHIHTLETEPRKDEHRKEWLVFELQVKTIVMVENLYFGSRTTEFQ